MPESFIQPQFRPILWEMERNYSMEIFEMRLSSFTVTVTASYSLEIKTCKFIVSEKHKKYNSDNKNKMSKAHTNPFPRA